MQSTLIRYKIGIGALGVLTLVLLIVVLAQAGATRKDADTYDAANKVVTKLNNYIDSKQKLPATLESAGITDVPSTVSYHKSSEKTYEFCVTYSAASDGFDPFSVGSGVTTGSTSSTGGNTAYLESTDSSYLYLSSTHHKGKNCQKVTPYIMGSSGYYDSNSSSSDPYAKCSAIVDNTAYYKCLQDSTPNTGSTSSTIYN